MRRKIPVIAALLCACVAASEENYSLPDDGGPDTPSATGSAEVGTSDDAANDVAEDDSGFTADVGPDSAESDVTEDAVAPCPDGDGDGVCDADDVCLGDDRADADADGVPDACDACPGFDDAQDTDSDGLPNGCDECDGELDADSDGISDECDICEGGDDAADEDEDGVPDHCDQCEGGDDHLDSDGDGAPDECDSCPEGPDTLDADGDSVPDACDLCTGSDDREDDDGDLLPNGCDSCPDDPENDSDGDRVCGDDDLCPGSDDFADRDSDGRPDGCDPCPDDNPNDSDGDGVCDSEDICSEGSDLEDIDGDGEPDGCDVCPYDSPNDSDGDTICDSDDVCDGDDRLDRDGDAVPDACDWCPSDAADDSDGDGVCDTDDICPGGNDRLDTDGDGTPNGCDACPIDAAGDSDGDTICDSDDICAGDDRVDRDGDGAPDACDICPVDRPNDPDGDGICQSVDPCPLDNPNDADGDWMCASTEGGGAVDTDGDGTADSLDSDSDADGLSDEMEAGDSDFATPPLDTDADAIPNYRDTDSDGDSLLDSFEGTADPDGDGRPNYVDGDSDGDFVVDAAEGSTDTDRDGTPDFLDADSDNDGIRDEHELYGDADGDGIPDRLELDSDLDGIPDSVEAGDSDPSTPPVDTDGDGFPDYIDYDSDDDGLSDPIEPGCSAGGSSRTSTDSDGDGYSDLAEVLVGADPCVPHSAEEFTEFTDFFFELPEDGPSEDAPLEFSSNIVQADVHIAMDTTGSMGGEIASLRSSFSSQIFPQTAAQIPNVAFGVSTFDDYPCNGHGSGIDSPFVLHQRITTNISAAQSAINGIPLHSGADYFESGYESMYQVASGAGVNGCGVSIPPFNPAAGRVPGVADGTIGGSGFRAGSLPVVIHVTDAPSHEESAYGSFAASRDEAVAALQYIQARFIGVASGSDPRPQLEHVARQTGGTVPVCAWDGARPAGCSSSQCCTGVSGAGRSSEAGMCPLVFDISGSGSGLNTAMVTAIDALVNTTNFDVTTRVRRDDDDFAATGVDTRCFVRSVTPDSFDTVGSCTTTPVAADIDPVDGVLDGFRNVTPGTQLFFDVVAQNLGCVDATEDPQAFTAYIDVIGDGTAVLDTRTVTIIVPAGDTNPYD